MATKKATKKPTKTTSRSTKKKVTRKATAKRRPYRTIGKDLANAIIRLQNDLASLEHRVEARLATTINWGDINFIVPETNEGEGSAAAPAAGEDESLGGEVL